MLQIRFFGSFDVGNCPPIVFFFFWLLFSFNKILQFINKKCYFYSLVIFLFGHFLFIFIIRNFYSFLAFQVMYIKFLKVLNIVLQLSNVANPHTHIEHLISTTNKASFFPPSILFLQSLAIVYLKQKETSS